MPLHLCTFAPLHLYTYAPLHSCTSAPLHLCTFVPLSQRVRTAPLHLCAVMPKVRLTPLTLKVRRCQGASDTLKLGLNLEGCKGAPERVTPLTLKMQRCGGALVFRILGPNAWSLLFTKSECFVSARFPCQHAGRRFISAFPY